MEFDLSKFEKVPEDFEIVEGPHVITVSTRKDSCAAVLDALEKEAGRRRLSLPRTCRPLAVLYPAVVYPVVGSIALRKVEGLAKEIETQLGGHGCTTVKITSEPLPVGVAEASPAFNPRFQLQNNERMEPA
jgi:hypothetical protein